MGFSRVGEDMGEPVRFTWNGHPLAGRAGDSVATALLLAGIEATRRSPVSGEPRGPFCLMGVCFECLVEIDGVPNQQACLTPLREGMSVAAQDASPDFVGS